MVDLSVIFIPDARHGNYVSIIDVDNAKGTAFPCRNQEKAERLADIIGARFRVIDLPSPSPPQ